MNTDYKLMKHVPLLGLAALLVSSSVWAQEEEDDGTIVLDRVVVTGSRLPVAADAPNFPVTRIDEIEFDLQANASTFELLQSLPQVAGTGNLQGRISSVEGSGESFIGLRGLEPNNTLVLINGRRVASSAGRDINNDAVNLNTIPIASVQNVEVLTYGQSPLYGSDAIAGVVNIQLWNDYDGAEVGGEYGWAITDDEGGARLFRTYMLAGERFENGSYTVSVSYQNQNGLLARDRSETVDADLTAFGGDNNRSSTGPRGRFNSPTLGPQIVTGFTNTEFYTDGVSFVADDPSDFADFSFGADAYNFNDFADELKPNKTWGITMAAEREVLGESMKLFVEGHYVRDNVLSILAPAPVFSEFEFFVTPSGDQVPVTIAADNPDNPFNEEGTFRRRFIELGPRISEIDVDNVRILTGARGNFMVGERLFTYETAIGYSEDHSVIETTGILNKQELFEQLQSDGTDGRPRFNVFASPVYNIENNQAALDRLSIRTIGEGTFSLLSYDARLSADVVQTPMGWIGAAAGFEWRREEWENIADPLVDAFNTVGSINAQSGGADRTVTSFFFEGYIPLASEEMDLPFLHSAELRPAVRVEDFSDFGTENIFGINGRVNFTKWASLRGSFTQNYRAPSLNDLGAGAGESFEFILATNGEVNAGTPGFDLLDPGQIQARTLFVGSSDLEPETGNTFTVGTVISAPPETFLRGFEVTFDYYNISIDDVIDELESDFIIGEIITAGTAAAGPNATIDQIIAAGAGAVPPGNSIQVDPVSNQVSTVFAAPANLASRDVSGFDYGLSYTIDLDEAGYGAGTLDWKFNYTHLLSYTEVLVPGGPTIDAAGDSNDATGQRFPRNQWNSRLTYSWEDLTVSGVLRYVEGVIENDTVNGGLRKTDNYYQFDIVASYQMPYDVTLTVGIDNLFDSDPPLLLDEGSNYYDRDLYSNIGRYIYTRLVKKF